MTAQTTELPEILERLRVLPNKIYKQGEQVVFAQAKLRKAKFELEATEGLVYLETTDGSVRQREASVANSSSTLEAQQRMLDAETDYEKCRLKKEYLDNEFIAARKIADVRREEFRTFAGEQRFS